MDGAEVIDKVFTQVALDTHGLRGGPRNLGRIDHGNETGVEGPHQDDEYGHGHHHLDHGETAVALLVKAPHHTPPSITSLLLMWKK